MDNNESTEKNIKAQYGISPEKGFESLYSTYYKDVFFFVLNLSADNHMAFDITQDVFVKAYNENGIRDYKIKSWLFRVALNEFYQFKRSFARRARYALRNIFRFLKDPADFREEYIEKSINIEQVENLRNCIGRLDEKDRAIIILRYYNDLSYAEIAQIANIEPGTVMSRLSRATARLREMMNKDE